jgi:hypothetical protein
MLGGTLSLAGGWCLPAPADAWFMLVVGPVLWGFVITLLLPQARNWILSLSMIGWGAICLSLGLLLADEEMTIGGVVVLLAGWPLGTLGIMLARELGPRRCRRSAHVEPLDDPRCPRCGYILYHAQGRRCPDCGRRFSLSELDLRLARWDGHVLRPRNANLSADPEPRSGDRV